MPTDPATCAFSVDVEDWYQVSDFDAVIGREAWSAQDDRLARSTDGVLALLDEAGVRATFFVLAWNAERHPELVRRIAAAGHEIASHGHHHRVVYELTPDAFRADVVRSKAVLEDLLGAPLVGYRAPSLSITRACAWALDVVLEAGFRYSSSILPAGDPARAFPGAPRGPHVIRERDGRALVEFPLTVLDLPGGRALPVGGGGWLRALPYPVFRWGMRRVLASGRPTVTYVHPWEIDPEHPRVRTAGRRGFSMHYVGLRGTERKLRRLLRDFRFAPCRDVLALAGLAC